MHAALRSTLAVGVAAGLTLALAGPAAGASKTQPVDLRFAATAGETPVKCGRSIDGLGTTRATAQISDFRFYVSEVKLLRRDGRAVPVKLRTSPFQATRGKDAVALIDLENGSAACAEGTSEVNSSVRGTVPKGKYVGVRWTVGVPFALNHSDVPAAPAPLNLAALGWSWQFGRIFSKIELTDPTGAASTWQARTFFIHLGSTGCLGNPAAGEDVKCQAPNRPRVQLKRFDPKRQQVAVDVTKFVEGSDVKANRANALGCMSGPRDPECGPVFGAFGLDWRADGSGKGTYTPGQTLYRAIDR